MLYDTHIFPTLNDIVHERFPIIAGPCSVESAEQFFSVLEFLCNEGIHIVRANVFKPRTSPYSFQGLGASGLKILEEAKKRFDVIIVSEILDVRDLGIMTSSVDIFQVGARNTQNTPLLKELGACGHPVLLKRGFMSTRDEFLCAAEYIVETGNDKIILCERGIRTFDSVSRNLLDIANIALTKQETSLPIIADVSHAAGRKDLIIPLAKAAIAAGADGLMVEVHPLPEEALSDAKQQLNFEEFSAFLSVVRSTYKSLNCFAKK